MNTVHAVGWPLCVCLVLTLSATAQVPTTGSVTTYEEIARKVVIQGDHTVTFVRVKPLTLPKAPPPPAPPEPTAEEKATAERRANKSYESITLTANVYLGARTVTELSWTEDNVTYRALSNVDFRLLTQLPDVETSDSVYLWFPFVYVADGDPPANISADDVAKLDTNTADYVLLGSSPESKVVPKALALLDYLHAYAQLNETKLRSDLTQREADEQAAEEKLKNTPPSNPVITFWVETGAKR